MNKKTLLLTLLCTVSSIAALDTYCVHEKMVPDAQEGEKTRTNRQERRKKNEEERRNKNKSKKDKVKKENKKSADKKNQTDIHHTFSQDVNVNDYVTKTVITEELVAPEGEAFSIPFEDTTSNGNIIAEEETVNTVTND